MAVSPGFCQTHENFRPQVAPLVSAGFRVVLWDYRGHGRSDAPEEPARYSIEQVEDDLGRVLDATAPGRRAVLGGLSFGGLASLHYTYAHPPRVEALILAGSGPGFKNPDAADEWRRRSPMRRLPEHKLRSGSLFLGRGDRPRSHWRSR